MYSYLQGCPKNKRAIPKVLLKNAIAKTKLRAGAEENKNGVQITEAPELITTKITKKKGNKISQKKTKSQKTKLKQKCKVGREVDN